MGRLLLADQQSGSASEFSFKSCRNEYRIQFRNNAEKITFPKKKLPPVSDYADRCAALIKETFPAPSQNQTCLNAAREVGASPDTFDRILSGLTKSPDAKLMLAVMAVRAHRSGQRDFNLGGGFAIRLIMENAQ